VAWLSAAGLGRAQIPLQVLHEFAAEPQYPNGVIQGSDGDFYGTSQSGGALGYGTTFKVTAGGRLSILHSFSSQEAYPDAPLVQASDGNFYGTTSSGGQYRRGTIFRMTPAYAVTTIYEFHGGIDGGYPYTALIQAADGDLYGTTSSVYPGGPTIFKISLGGAFTTLHVLDRPTEGENPSALLQARDGVFYGTTSLGVFRITPQGAFGILHTFTASEATGSASAPLIQAADGNFYGATTSTLFRMSASGAVTILYKFPFFNPAASPLVQAIDGSFLGTTPGYSSDYGPDSPATVFRLSIDGGGTASISYIHAFNGNDGSNPGALVSGRDGRLYGTALGAIQNVFSISPSGAFAVLHSFIAGSNGRLVQADDGLFYGTTSGGGDFGRGSVYRMTATGAVTTLYSFSGGLDGGVPQGGVVEGRDGLLYGTTSINGAYNAGTIFQMTRSGQLATLHWFRGDAAEGGFPRTPPVQGLDGRLFGFTGPPRTPSERTAAYSVTPQGSFAVLHVFGNSESVTALVQGTSGDLYGTSGNDSAGRIFRMTTDGAVTVLHSLSASTDGSSPVTLVQASDGSFYGTISYGPTNFPISYDGAIFRVTPTGVYTVLHSFASAEGEVEDLVLGSDGLLYSATARTLTRLTLDGTPSILHTYGAAEPYASRLLSASDGNLYATSDSGGQLGGGVAYRLNPRIPLAPATISVRHAAARSILLSWSPVPGATNYVVKRGVKPGQETLFASGLTSTSFRDTAATGTQRYYYVVTAANQYGESMSSQEVSMVAARATIGDFDGDGKTDIAVARPSTQTWQILTSGSSFKEGVQYAAPIAAGDRPVPGDYDGDAVADIAVYRPSTGTWSVLTSSTNFKTTVTYQWGAIGDLPVQADYDGDGRTDVAVYRPSTGVWYILTSRSGFAAGVAYALGADADLPVPADYDGDGRTDLAVYRPSSGHWFILLSSSSYASGPTYHWGTDPRDAPLPADYDGDGRADLGIYRYTGAWYFLLSSTNYASGTTLNLGASLDQPLPGDYDGDGTADLAVFRPATGNWFVRSVTTSSVTTAYQWGAPGDRPVLAALPPPPSPSTVHIAPASSGRVSLSWSPVYGAVGYTIRRRSADGTDQVQVQQTEASARPAFLDAKATKGRRYYYTVSALNAFGEGMASYEVSITAGGAVPGDYDGDGKTDLALFRPSTGQWLILNSGTSFTTASVYQWGTGTDVMVPGDYDGDGRTDAAVFRPATSQWFILPSSANGASSLVYQWGGSGDRPVPADYDGDGKADLAAFRFFLDGTWYVSVTPFAFGVASSGADLPLTGDFDGDGRADAVVFEPATGAWYIHTSTSGFRSFWSYAWGQTGDVPIPGDYDGDGRTDIAVYRPATGHWFILLSSANFAAAATYQWGLPGDIPVPGDYDGDGQTDFAVYRPSSGTWLFLLSSVHYTGATIQWGAPGDVPVSSR
jgi:uncharacterized repeat protein (TIGR03803 family)